MKTEIETLAEALRSFKKKYPDMNSGDLQTFILGWEACMDFKHNTINPES